MHNLPRRRYKPDKSATKRELKSLIAAEARHRYELLEEERELKHNLADFWDTSLDKIGNRRGRLHETDGH